MSAASPSPSAYSPGLEGVVGGETAISCIDDGLRYRGYPVGELCEKATFDEVAHLLLHGDLPTAKQLADFQARVTTARRIPEPVKQLYPHTPAGRTRSTPSAPPCPWSHCSTRTRRTTATRRTCGRPSGCSARCR